MEGNKSFISEDTVIKGNIVTSNDIEIEGSVEGDINNKADIYINKGKVKGRVNGNKIEVKDTSLIGNIKALSAVLIHAGSMITGNIHGKEVVVEGKVSGNITANEKLTLENGSMVNGDVRIKSLKIDENAVLNGNVSMSTVAKVVTENVEKKEEE